MNATTWIDVTAEDVRDGERCQSQRCPIALAIERALPNADALVNAHLATVSVGPTDRRMLRLPVEAARAVVKYDETGEMRPFGFELDLEGRDL